MTIKPVYTEPTKQPHSLHIRVDKDEARRLADYLAAQGYWHQEDIKTYQLFSELLKELDAFGG